MSLSYPKLVRLTRGFAELSIRLFHTASLALANFVALTAVSAMMNQIATTNPGFGVTAPIFRLFVNLAGYSIIVACIGAALLILWYEYRYIFKHEPVWDQVLTAWRRFDSVIAYAVIIELLSAIVCVSIWAISNAGGLLVERLALYMLTLLFIVVPCWRMLWQLQLLLHIDQLIKLAGARLRGRRVTS